MIPFNKAPCLPKSEQYVMEAMQSGHTAGNGPYTKRCAHWLEERFRAKKVLLTTSCTSALEMAALLLELHPGDEIILPSYTFVSTANAFALCGARLVFVDIRPDTMNVDEDLIEDAITERTRAIVVVHYAGVACEMDAIMSLARRHGLVVIEDAAQGVMSQYRGVPLGTIGDLGCYSFHETKNYTMGEGGALVINDERYIERAEVLWEKGTNRNRFYRGIVDKYSWVDLGSSFLPSEISAAYLYAQLEQADEINEDRMSSWKQYFSQLSELRNLGLIQLPYVPEECKHNAHMFYIKLANLKERTAFIKYMREREISCVFHYVPLHSSKAGQQFGRLHGEDRFTTRESDRLVRLPLHYRLENQDIVIKEIKNFFGS